MIIVLLRWPEQNQGGTVRLGTGAAGHAAEVGGVARVWYARAGRDAPCRLDGRMR
ncbi:hypothetical protein [Undibacterium sp. TS12]|uniref:hypothetical protein n=1 Tax=Undibacterium sp. TS12 TaxID=2908202 RepID=UPI001F4D0B94|nr:hypothetical protein [Undibacterium sp. TS12]MCH8619571.1 hypothetical protein [Undibacterium sp. TS12]